VKDLFLSKQNLLSNLLFCRQRIIVYQYSETNLMQFLFSLLRIKGLYIFRALLAHPQEVLQKRHLVHCVRVMSVGCYQVWSGTGVCDISNARKMKRPLIVYKLNEKCITLFSLY
jgi:hypothetical protein